MKRLQAYRFALKTNGENQRNMRLFAGSSRFVFNKALALQKSQREAGQKPTGYAGLCKLLTQWKWFISIQTEREIDPPIPQCDHVSKENRQTQAQFVCVKCGYENNADFVGAINILSRGMQILRDEGQDTSDPLLGRESAAQIACEVNGEVSRQQQEPTEATHALAA